MRYRFVLLALAAAVTGCSLGLDVPPGTAIACAAQNECPENFVCQVSLSRCVPLGYDVTPPALNGSPIITPAVAGASATVTVSFATSKPLGIDPVVTLVFGPTVQKSARRSVNTNMTEFVYTYAPDLSEPQTAASVVIIMTDVAGNQSSSETPAAVLFDFEAPTLFAEATRLSVAPPAGSVLAPEETSAITLGGVATLRLQTSEVLAPESRVIVDGADLGFVQASVLGTAYVYSLAYAGGATDGPHEVSFEAIDAAGNASTTSVGSLLVDTVPPSTPLTTTQDKIVYRRSPWQADRPTRFTLSGASGAFEPGILVTVLDAPDSTAQVLARPYADAAGALPTVGLPELDRQRIYVQAVDTAGNTSPVQLVQDVDWVGSFDPQGLSSPHAAFAFKAKRRGLATVAGERLSTAQLRALGTADDSPSAWRQVDLRRPWVRRVAQTQRGHFFFASTYDARRAEIVTFGGQIADVISTFGSQDFALWNGDWRTPTNIGILPDARFGHAMAYDAYRDRVVLYGGQTGTSVFDDTWEWDGEGWTKLSIGGPGGLTFHAMTFDSDTGRVVLVGGCFDASCSDVSGETWAFDGNSWTPLATNTPPAARLGHSLTVYQNGLVLFGGCPAGASFDPSAGALQCSSYLRDRWVLDGNTWTNISDGTEPSARAFHAAVWDDADNLYIYGGSPFSSASADGRVWASDGSDFFVAFDPARPVTGVTGAYHQGLRKAVFFGGIFDEDLNYTVRQDNVFIDGGAFAPASSTGTPEVRVLGGLAYSGSIHAFVQSGGGTAISGLNRGTSMYWNGTGWTPLGTNVPDAAQSTCSDGARGGGVSVFDPVRARVVTLCANRTFELAGASNWGEVCTTAGCRGTLPAATSGYAMAYDSVAQRMLLFGGGSANATSQVLYAYNGNLATNAWTTSCSVGVCNPPPARRCAGMAYDVARNRTVMFGGGSTYCDDPFDSEAVPGGNPRNDTWEWNNGTTSWTQVCTGGGCVRPPTRHHGLLVYDSMRARIVLIGAGYADIWEWNGVRWIERFPEGAEPTPRRAPAIGYDPQRQVLGLFGGRDDDANNEIWELDLDPEQRPAVLFDFDWTLAGVPRTSVRQVRFHARAGGRGNTNDTSLAPDGDTIGEPRAGAQLEYWTASTDWFGIQSTAADVNTVGDINAQATTGCGEPLLNRDGHVYARVSPTWGDGNGEVPASLVVDEADVTVRYTIGLDACP